LIIVKIEFVDNSKMIGQTSTKGPEERKPGYYWLKSFGEWGIGEWYASSRSAMWFIPGDEDAKQDSDFDEIDENRIKRIIRLK